MKALFNDQISNFVDIAISPGDRAFQYGDGIFETVAAIEGKPRHLRWHMERLAEGLAVLDISTPKKLAWPQAANTVAEVLSANNLTGDTRLKIQVWRAEGGLYRPHTSGANYLVTAVATDFSQPQVRNMVSLSKTVKNQFSLISGYKTMSALKYVLAGIEMQARQLDDIVVTDVEGCISECLASNIFWVKYDWFYTPGLESGCVNGVMRRYIIQELEKMEIPVFVGRWLPEDLMDATAVFATNATGIQHIENIDGKAFAKNALVEKIVYGRG